MYRNANAVIPLSSLTNDELEELRDDLTLKNPAYENAKRFTRYKVSAEIPEHLEFYKIENGKIIIPRNYYNPTDFKDRTLDGDFADIKFLHELRDYQTEFFSGVDYTENDLIFEVPCGHGKTTMSLYLASKIKRKTLVFVPTKYLVKQWINRIEYFTGETPQLITSELLRKISKKEVKKTTKTASKKRGISAENNQKLTSKSQNRRVNIFNSLSLYNSFFNSNIYLITFDMYNSIKETNESLLRDELVYFLDSIGLVIFDELHCAGARSYVPIVSDMPATKRLGLTATLRRLDGNERILKYHFGKSYKLPNQFPKANLYRLNTRLYIDRIVPVKKLQPDIVHALELLGIDSEINGEYLHFNPNTTQQDIITKNKQKLLKAQSIYHLKIPAQVSQLDSYITTGKFLKMYQSIIRKCLESGRTVLVLSKRKQALKLLYSVFKDEYPTSIVISETGKQTEEQEDFLNNTAKLILGINQLASFGLDIDRIDTLVVLHPVSDSEQMIGRIIRYAPNKLQPLVLAPVSNHQAYFGLFKKFTKFAVENANLKNAIKITELRNVLNEESYSPY